MKNNNQYYKLIVTLLCLVIGWNAQAQVNYKVHSLFVYKFTQYIEWPSQNGDFVIGVVGNSPILVELEAIAATKKVGARSIVVKKLAASADLSGCQMIFVSEGQSGSLGSISSKLAGKNILIISETNGGAKKGAGINFVIIDDKMKFELNKGAVERQGLKVSGDLTKLAIVVG
jgi:hypothetical protein